jgi:hypothetical protein
MEMEIKNGYFQSSSDTTEGEDGLAAWKYMPAGTVCAAECAIELEFSSGLPAPQSNFTCVDGAWVGELQCPANTEGGDDPTWEGNEVTLKDGHFYRTMSELYPMAGGLQRAAATSYCGLHGHMATPESLDEAKLIAQVVQGSTRNNGSSMPTNFDLNTGVY